MPIVLANVSKTNSNLFGILILIIFFLKKIYIFISKMSFPSITENYQLEAKSELISPLENIVSEYSSIDDYAKLIKYNPKLYSFKKYFKGKLPDIYKAIDVYDNLDLIKYIIKKSK